MKRGAISSGVGWIKKKYIVRFIKKHILYFGSLSESGNSEEMLSFISFRWYVYVGSWHRVS